MHDSLTAIVVDDDNLSAKVLCDYLEIIEIDVLGTGDDGQDAVELYKKHGPDVVFLDLLMPKYDGYYAIENIKRIDPNAKVVIVTADLSLRSSRGLELFNPTRIIFKPFSVDAIIDVIEDVRRTKQGTSLTH